MSFKTRAVTAFALSIATAIVGPALAHGDGDITTSVRVQRIAVRSPADARRLERRLGEAALTVCGGEDHDLSERRDAIRRSACYADALRAARADAGIADATATASAAPFAASGRP